MLQATENHTSTRRSILSALAAAPIAALPVAAPLAVAAEASTTAGVSPSLLALKREFDELHSASEAVYEAMNRARPFDLELQDEWDAALSDMMECVREIVSEPAASLADLAIKLNVWRVAFPDDFTKPGEGPENLDDGPRFLLTEARALLARAHLSAGEG